MTLEETLKLPPLKGVKKDDSRYDKDRIMDQPVKADEIVSLTGYLYLVAFESDDCDLHIQLTTKPISGTPAKDDNSMIVEVPSGEYAMTISAQEETVRDWVVKNLLAGNPPKMNSIHVMQHPVHVTITECPASTSSERIMGLPCLLIAPSRCFPPEELACLPVQHRDLLVARV